MSRDPALPRLNLLVIRSSDIDRAAAFYRHLGLSFTRHAHGSGPEHYAAELNDMVFEIYPASLKWPLTIGTRIGFVVSELDAVVAALAIAGAMVQTPPTDSEWGRRAVVKDPDGHIVELTQATPS